MHKMLNLNKRTKTKSKPKVNGVIHNTAQNSSDNFPSYPPDNHHCSDDVYWRARGKLIRPENTAILIPTLPQHGVQHRPCPLSMLRTYIYLYIHIFNMLTTVEHKGLN